MASLWTAPSRNHDPSSEPLLDAFAAVLPKGYQFGVYHISTPPTLTEALFHAPADHHADRTYREAHFLSITIDVDAESQAQQRPEKRGTDDGRSANQVIVFSVEIFIYTTAFSSVFFVSKADSSGYLHLLKLRRGTPSPIREIISSFVAYLVQQRQRKHVQSVISLFARSQSQYLFPGSADNAGKHVLDDRGLVKWWCSVLGPLLRAGNEEPQPQTTDDAWESVEGYLIVPGLDHYETRAFLPRSPAGQKGWTIGHPLEKMSRYVHELGSVPPRCLVPRFPDDPKARYLDELDEEVERPGEKKDGAWKSIKTLDQFWEMMAFRQECSSGRLTGFIWVVFNPPKAPQNEAPSFAAATAEKDAAKPRTRRKKQLRGVVVSRPPRAKTQQRQYFSNRPESTPYYYWPAQGRGKLLVDESDYKRINELLLQLDFSTLEKSVISTTRWIAEAGVGSDWRLEVTGRREAVMSAAPQSGDKASGTSMGGGATKSASLGSINVLSAGLVRKRRKGTDSAPEIKS